jgi:hypothetical protein
VRPRAPPRRIRCAIASPLLTPHPHARPTTSSVTTLPDLQRDLRKGCPSWAVGMPNSLSILLATACPTLPAYHPDTLMQYAVWGELDRVRGILRHLYESILVCEAGAAAEADSSGDKSTGHARTRPWRSTPMYLVDTLPPVTLAGLLALPGAGGTALASRLGAANTHDALMTGARSVGSAPRSLTSPVAELANDRYDALFGAAADGGDISGGLGGRDTDGSDDAMEAIYPRLEGWARGARGCLG